MYMIVLISYTMYSNKNFKTSLTLKNCSYSTGASDRSFYPFFTKRFDNLETLLTIPKLEKRFVSWIPVRAFSVQSPLSYP